jgi:hypothetical protein
MRDPELVFRAKLLPYWRVMTKIGSVVAIFFIAVLAATGERDPKLVLLEVLVPVMYGVIITVGARSIRVTLTPKGIRCPDRWGVYRLSRWEVIDDVRPRSFLGLRALRFDTSDEHRRFWLPLHLSDIAGFATAVAQLAGPNHPLTQALLREAPVEFARDDPTYERGSS